MPKHRTAAVLLSLLLATTTYGQDEDVGFDSQTFDIEYCKWISILARDIMKARQQHTPMSETLPLALDRFGEFPMEVVGLFVPELEDLDDEEQAELRAGLKAVLQKWKPLITQMVMAAYEAPAFDSEVLQRDAISDYENTFFAECYAESEETEAALEE